MVITILNFAFQNTTIEIQLNQNFLKKTKTNLIQKHFNTQ